MKLKTVFLICVIGLVTVAVLSFVYFPFPSNLIIGILCFIPIMSADTRYIRKENSFHW